MTEKVLDGTDAFDVKLDLLRRFRAPEVEINASISVYERMRTAKAIAQALLPADGVDPAVVVALACEIGAEVHRSQGTRSPE